MTCPMLSTMARDWANISSLTRMADRELVGSVNTKRRMNQYISVPVFHEPPGRQHVRVTVEYITGELKVYVVDRAVLAKVLKRLDSPP
jgi:hypothetical protein